MVPMKRALVITFGLLVATSCANGGDSPETDGGSTDDAVGDAMRGGAGGRVGDRIGDTVRDTVRDAVRDRVAIKDSGVDAPLTPKLESTFPPYGLTWTPTGNPGRAGGLTWTYTGIDRGKLHHIYWIVCDDPSTPCGLSLNGPITASSEWAFDATDSDLPSGKLIFTNSTAIMTADAGTVPLSGRLTVTIVGAGGASDAGGAPIAFADVGTLGVTARDGKYGAEITGTGFTVTVLAEVEDTTTSTWTPYLVYYDAAHTVPPDAGNANVSFGGSFYDD
jgi:hypothetical protein